MNLPQAYLNRMKDQLGEDFPAYLVAMDEPEKRAARANGLKTSPQTLAELRPDFVPTGGEGFLLPSAFAPGKDPLHAAGAYYVQELSAQMPVTLFDLTPGMAVLDLCAAPGGKSAQLAARVPRGVLFANEIVPGRANVLLGNLERMGVRNAVVTAMDPEKLIALTGPVFDAVLVDAPCAGEGMFRKDPGAVAEWSEEHVLACARRQRAILTSAQRAVKPGGQLIYSTCSFSPAENEENAAWFLSAFPDLELAEERRLYPHTSLGEGQYAAKFRRRGAAPETAYLPVKSDKAPLVEAFLSAETADLSGPLRLLPDGRALLLPPLPCALDGLRLLRAGLLLGEVAKGRFVPAHALAMAAGLPLRQRAELSHGDALRYLRGETLPTALSGWCAVTHAGLALGLGKGADGILKNHLPKGLRIVNL